MLNYKYINHRRKHFKIARLQGKRIRSLGCGVSVGSVPNEMAKLKTSQIHFHLLAGPDFAGFLS